MNEIKTLGYDWELGHEELVIKVGSYLHGGGLSIRLYHMQDGELEDFGDLTKNLPRNPLEVNEGFITDLSSKEKIKFIRKHRLGKVLPEFGYSGFCKYAKVAFDLERLAELDREGVERFKKQHRI